MINTIYILRCLFYWLLGISAIFLKGDLQFFVVVTVMLIFYSIIIDNLSKMHTYRRLQKRSCVGTTSANEVLLFFILHEIEEIHFLPTVRSSSSYFEYRIEQQSTERKKNKWKYYYIIFARFSYSYSDYKSVLIAELEYSLKMSNPFTFSSLVEYHYKVNLPKWLYPQIERKTSLGIFLIKYIIFKAKYVK